MKRLLFGLILSAVAGSSHAVPFAYSGSSLSATGAIALGSYTSNSGSADIAVGDSELFDFGTVSVLGVGSGTLSLTVNFTSPTEQDVSVTNPYSVIATLIYNEGQWSGGATEFGYTYNGYSGSALLSLDPIKEACLLCAPTFDFHGSIKNLSLVAVPAPATLGLLGLGLLGLGVMRRRRV